MQASQVDSRRFFAIASLLSAIVTVILVATAAPPVGPAADLLSSFRAHQGRYLLLAVVVLIWAIVSVLHVVAIGRLVAADRPVLAFAGTLLLSGGVLLLGFGTFEFVGAFFSIMAAGDTTGQLSQASFHAIFWANLSFMLSDPGLMTMGAGQLIVGWLLWSGRGMPRYVAAAGMTGGIAGLLTLAVYQTPMLAIIQLLAFALTAAATGIALLIRQEPAAS